MKMTFFFSTTVVDTLTKWTQERNQSSTFGQNEKGQKNKDKRDMKTQISVKH